VIPAIDLIVPPGWSFRGLYIGYIRAALELGYQLTKSDEKKPDDKKQDTVTRMPKLDPTPMDGDDDNSVIVTVTEESSKEDSSIIIPMVDDSSYWDGNPDSSDEQGW
jgi:hypothetical protein